MVGLVLSLVVALSPQKVRVTPGEALYAAIDRDDARAIRRAVRAGASLRVPPKGYDEPPLFYALSSPGTFELLRRMGAPIDGTDEYGRTLLHRLVSDQFTWRRNGRQDPDVFARYLAGSHNGQVKINVPWDRRGSIATDLVRHGLSLEANDHRGLTALHYAVQDDWRGVAMLLRLRIREASDVFLYQRAYGKPRDEGADPNAVDNDGETPLILLPKDSSRSPRVDREAIIAGLLLDAGADLDRRDHSGRTAQDWARENGDEALAAIIEVKRKEPEIP